MAIFFHDEGINSGLKNKRAIRSWFKQVLLREGKKCGQINIILAGDKYLRNINKKYLSRDYYTDIITFDYSEGKVLNGDLFISLERVKENGKNYGEGEEKELLRVMVHGLLHLAGYDDKQDEERERMKGKESEYLSLYLQSE